MTRLVRWNPVREAMTFSKAMDRAFAEFAKDRNFSMDTSRPLAMPALDVIDNEGYVEVQINLPGVAPNDVDIEIKEGILTISTSVNTDETHEDARYTYRERYQGSYQRSLRVPDTIDVEKTEASFENGVLSLHMPKKPESQPVKIAVTGSKALKSGKK